MKLQGLEHSGIWFDDLSISGSSPRAPKPRMARKTKKNLKKRGLYTPAVLYWSVIPTS
jgi:hypothetical protein